MIHWSNPLRRFATWPGVAAILLIIGIAVAHAQQFMQQGPKLVGTDTVGGSGFQGYSVSLSGDGNTALIGGFGDNAQAGAAWVFTQVDTTWMQQGSKLVGTGAVGSAHQGQAVALSANGNTALLGAPFDNSSAGAAWVFTRAGNAWSQQGSKLVGTGAVGPAPPGQGYAVALCADGNTALIGGLYDNSDAGAVWVFTRAGNTWIQQGSKLVGSGAVGNARQGASVALSGDGNTALVGGYADNGGGGGAAWIFIRTGTTWLQQGPKLFGTGAVGNASQGVSVALSSDGNTALVGGYHDNNQTGAAWVFTRVGNTWSQQGTKLVGSGAVGPAYQGASVALSTDGNIALVGGLYDNSFVGAVWAFKRIANAWTQLGTKFVGTGAIGSSQQGSSVGLSSDGNIALVGGTGDNTAAGAAWVFAQQSMRVTSPSAGEVVQAGLPYDIGWREAGVTLLRIEASLDSGRTYRVIADSVQASPLHYSWAVAETLLSAKARIKLSSIDGTGLARSPAGISSESARFKVKGYVLTRFTPNGDYERFDPTLHGWSFSQAPTNMWPQSWWRQFDYSTGVDFYTSQRYPSTFAQSPILARSPNFVDWPLFVRTFGVDSCYRNVSQAVYSPVAVQLWAANKDRSYYGACYGFAVSSLVAFDHYTGFLQKFPEVGTFQKLHDLPLDSLSRRVVNQLFETQYGYLQQKARLTRFQNKTLRQTLEDLKYTLHSDTTDHGSLSMLGSGGGHSVTPYLLERGTPGRWELNVYDSNCPTSDCHGVVIIDSASDHWDYYTLHESHKGIFLEPPANGSLDLPLLWDGELNENHPLATSYMRVFNSDAAITITDSIGETIGFHDSTTFNGFSDGIPILPLTGNFHRPIGYFIPSGAYSIQMNGFADSATSFSALNKSQMFAYWRSEPLNTQTDRLSYRNGLAVGNPDVETKSVNLESIVRLGSDERAFQVLNCPAVHNDSMSIATPDNDRLKFLNRGPQKTYDLNIELAGVTSRGSFVHASITLPANSSHYIVPNWQDLQHQPVRIYEDIGNIGTIHDTLVIVNQATGVGQDSKPEMPREFALEQNYPNPFNPTTEIRYQIPKVSYVTLKVFDVLGREVATLANEMRQPGVYTVQFNGSNLASGVYFYRLDAGGFTSVKKLLLLK